jgi:hypothetical protein
MLRNRSRNQRPTKPSFYIFVDGETERAYLNGLKSNLKNSFSLTIEPKLKSSDLVSSKKSSSYFIRKLKEEKNKGYDMVYCLLDNDVILSRDRSITDGEEKPSEKLKKIREYFKKDNNSIEILVNSPCFELWLLLHFTYTTRDFNNCSEVINELKKCDSSYEKSIKKYEKIYKEYEDKLKSAIDRAKQLDEEKTESQAQIYKIIEKLIRSE